MIEKNVAGSVAWIDIPGPLQADGERGIRSLTDEIRDCMVDDDLKAVVLVLADSVPETARRDTMPNDFPPVTLRSLAGPTGLYEVVAYSSKPVITQVQGTCQGIACLLALYSDITVAGDDVTFHSPFSHVADSNFVMASLTLRHNRAKWWLLSGDPIDARTAVRFGLVQSVAELADLRNRTAEIAARIGRVPSDALTISKMNINACLDALGVGQDFDTSGLLGAAREHPHHLASKGAT